LAPPIQLADAGPQVRGSIDTKNFDMSSFSSCSLAKCQNGIWLCPKTVTPNKNITERVNEAPFDDVHEHSSRIGLFSNLT
jgi:hypothetical protein